MILDQYRSELERLGYAIVAESEHEVVGVRSKWYWDLMATNMTSVVFLRATGPLSAENILSETDRMVAYSKEVDPFPLPWGFQHGRSAVAVYIADSVAADAQALCNSPRGGIMPTHYFPAALDRTSGLSYYLRTTPVFGALLYSKVRYPVQRLLDPGSTPERERVSIFGSILGLFILAILVASIGIFVWIALLLTSL